MPAEPRVKKAPPEAPLAEAAERALGKSDHTQHLKSESLLIDNTGRSERGTVGSDAVERRLGTKGGGKRKSRRKAGEPICFQARITP